MRTTDSSRTLDRLLTRLDAHLADPGRERLRELRRRLHEDRPVDAISLFVTEAENPGNRRCVREVVVRLDAPRESDRYRHRPPHTEIAHRAHVIGLAWASVAHAVSRGMARLDVTAGR